MIYRLLIVISTLMLMASCSTGKVGKKLPSTNSASSIIKSDNDKREYKALTLPNQLKVLLISDSEAEQATAALNVGVGQFDDPVDRQGLAHFLEHMLFLGNEKYPEAEAFGAYLSAHGGRSNAFTGLEKTTFFFTINNTYLDEALDQFAQFFIGPTFNQEFVEREVNAVHSEHQKNLKTDDRRIYQITRFLANPEHPLHKFGTGNLETLYGDQKNPEDLRNALVQFFNEKYSSNKMTLVIMGDESVSKLEQMARQHFSSIKNKNLTVPSYKGVSVYPEPLNRTVFIKPVMSVRRLKFHFPIPPQSDLYLHKPTHLVASMIGDESEGSLLASLKRKGWATALSAGMSLDTDDFAVFGVTIDLTEEGENHVDEIASRLFYYIDQLKSRNSLKSYYDELKMIAEVEFKFHEKEEETMYASRLAAALQRIPTERLLAYPWLYGPYEDSYVRDILSRLTPENTQLLVIGQNGSFSETERWYGTEYRVERNRTTTGWTRFDGINDIKLPVPNPFIVSDVELIPLSGTSDNPRLIYSGDNGRIWFKQDDIFRLPKGNIFIRLSTPEAYSSVKTAALTKLFTMLLKDSLNEYAYPASVAGLNYSIHNGVQGVDLIISGYSENISKLFLKIAEGVDDMRVDPARFEVFRDKIKQDRQNQKLGQAFRRVSYESYYLLSEPIWHTDEYIAIIDDLTPDDLTRFIPRLLSNMFVEVLAHGNFSEFEVKMLGQGIIKRFSSSSQAVSKPLRERTVAIGKGNQYVYAFQVPDVNSAIELYYQAGPQNVSRQVGLATLAKIMEKAFYHQLRTIEQLGYVVWSGSSQLNNIDGFYFVIQSNIKDPAYLEARIKAFITDFYTTLTIMTDEELRTYKDALIAERQEPPKNLSEETRRYWRVITSGDFDFDYRDKEIEAVKLFSREELVRLYSTMFMDVDEVKSLSVMAIGKDHQLGEVDGNKISDVKQFTTSNTYFENSENHQLLKLLEIQEKDGKNN